MAINVLSPRIYNRISAGEVVERPASVVKELVENSLDAGATKIKINIIDGGIKKICISDNGCGIEKEDLPLAFLSHATSKINSIDDLDEISTLGFRGEALASIASVARVELTTKTKDSETGFHIQADAGEISKITEVARLNGTTLNVQDLFFNTPARAKFLKKPKTEESEITHLVEKLMLAHPEVSFEYVVDGKTVYDHSSSDLSEAIYQIYGREIFESLLKLDYSEENVKVSGFVVSPKYSRPNRTYQTLFVNDRYVENYQVSACVQGAYEPLLMKGRFPIYVIKLSVPFDRVDVNVHPNKKEVKFDDSSRILGMIRRAVERALLATNLIAEFEFTNKDETDWDKFHINKEENPMETNFNSFTKTNFDKSVTTEHGINNISVDKTDRKILSPKDYQKKGIKIINMPDFGSVKANKKNNKNRPGGNIYFDHSGDSMLSEVELLVEQDIKKEQEEKVIQFVEEKFLKSKVDEIKILGIAFKTYILTEFEDSVYIVDQHAMHERQLYDKLKDQLEKNNIAKQDLLVPYEFSLIAKDSENFSSKIDNLQKIGFEIVQGKNTFKITCVPFVLLNINLENFISEVLADETLSERKASEYVNEKLCQTACKHAIRAGDSVSKEQIAYLIEKMQDGVALCPHGRPIIVKITRKEFEKMFKRTF